jgi:hypothetical protein
MRWNWRMIFSPEHGNRAQRGLVLMLRMMFAAPFLVCVPVAVQADIQPQDGTWASAVEFVDQVGCPPQMVAQMQTNMGSGHVGDLVFPDPFDPVALQNADLQFTWTKLDENVWQGIYSDISDSGMGNIIAVSKSVVTVVDPTHIEQDAEMNVTLPEAMAKMAGMPSNTCVVRSKVFHARQP